MIVILSEGHSTGGSPPYGVPFRKPSAIYHAHFMARLIYALKILIFREFGFKLTKQEIQGLGSFCVFGIGSYVKSWFLYYLPTAAPANDFQLLKLLEATGLPAYKGPLRKLCGQLWYLSEELVAFAFLDRDVNSPVKKTIIKHLSHDGTKDPPICMSFY